MSFLFWLKHILEIKIFDKEILYQNEDDSLELQTTRQWSDLSSPACIKKFNIWWINLEEIAIGPHVAFYIQMVVGCLEKFWNFGQGLGNDLARLLKKW